MAYPNFTNQFYNNPYMNMGVPMPVAQSPTPQQSQIIHVQNENQAREWSVALGSSVTFIDDSRPYCYTKSMGMSQLEPPVFKRFRLEEEIDEVVSQPNSTDSSAQIDMSLYMTKSEFEPFKAIIEDMQSIAKELRGIE